MIGACAMNKVMLMGRLTADPELRQTASGVSSCQFTVAVTRNHQGQNGEKQTDFINVVAWRQTAEFVARYFLKGRLILVEGELRTRTYDDKKYPDVRHYATEVYADSVSFGETKSSSNNAPAQQSGGNYAAASNNAATAQSGQNTALTGDMSDFEEVISDSELPF